MDGINVACLYGLKLFFPVLCGPSVAVLTSRLAVLRAVGCFGWLDRCATLAHEM